MGAEKGGKTMISLTVEEYMEKLNYQNGVCAICQSNNNNRALSVDHNHITGENRGLLCVNCNVGIGFLKEDIEILRKSIDYFQHYNK